MFARRPDRHLVGGQSSHGQCRCSCTHTHATHIHSCAHYTHALMRTPPSCAHHTHTLIRTLHTYAAVATPAAAAAFDFEKQFSWCGFGDHTRRTRGKCPMHPEYNGPRTPGVAVSTDWVSMSQAARRRLQRGCGRTSRPRVRSTLPPPRVPTSVVCAPSAASWTATHWAHNTSAFDDGWEPQTCTAPDLYL